MPEGTAQHCELVEQLTGFRSEFDSLDFLQINIETLCSCGSAEFQALKRIFTAASSDPLNIDGDDTTTVRNGLRCNQSSAVHQHHKLIAIDMDQNRLKRSFPFYSGLFLPDSL